MFLMIALVVLALLVVGYFYATARVSIVAYKAEGVAATENAALFAQTQEALAQGTFEGTVFNDAALGPIENYAWITYTLRLSNQCLVPVDMVEVQVVPDQKLGPVAEEHSRYGLRSADGERHHMEGVPSLSSRQARDRHRHYQRTVIFYPQRYVVRWQ